MFSPFGTSILLIRRVICDGLVGLMRLDVDELAAVFTYREHHDAVDKCKEGVVFAHAYVKTRVVLSAALALENVAGFAL